MTGHQIEQVGRLADALERSGGDMEQDVAGLLRALSAAVEELQVRLTVARVNRKLEQPVIGFSSN